ncbi:hypothetical protein MIR68_003369 [Amoeboaphelidium protococcarum]|nr:hypothetical protein MIR68_003369 [Amoeboaphelidium protococcarum]
MDFYNQQLAALELEITDLVKKQTRLQKKDQQGTITDEEEIELAGIDKLLEKLEASAKRYESFIKLAIKEPTEVMTFKDADEEWTQSVTGVDTLLDVGPASSSMKIFSRVLDSRLHLKKFAKVSISLLKPAVAFSSTFSFWIPFIALNSKDVCDFFQSWNCR